MQPLVVLLSTSTLILMCCYASQPPAELYWQSLLPRTSMPKAIQERLTPGSVEDWGVRKIHPDACLFYLFFPLCITSTMKEMNDPRRNLFFTESDLKLGTKKDLYLIKSSNHANFIPHKVVDLDPFTSKNITISTNLLLAQPNSQEAKDMRNTIDMCGELSNGGSCVTSLEAMLDFTTLTLGRKVEPLISESDQADSVRSYGIMDLKNMKNKKSVVCHKLTYPYAVYKCHSVSNTRAYKVSLATDGRKINVVAMCHIDTSRWSPEHLAFDVLKIKPGTVPVCHLVPGDHIGWVPTI